MKDSTTALDPGPVAVQAGPSLSRRSSAALELHHAGSGAGPGRSPAGESGRDQSDLATVATAFRGFLESLGLDLDDPNLVGTDERVACAYRELLGGLGPGAEPRITTFPNTERHAGIVAVTGIPFYSMCAHHFLPFFGAAHVGYVPGERLVGLSKLARVVNFYARRPQLQERMTEQVAALLDERLAPAGVIVSLEARHLCMEMRGVSLPGVTTTTTATRGTLKDAHMHQQFLAGLRGRAERSPRET